MRALASCLLAGLLSFSSAFAAETSVKDIETRPGVTQRVLLIRPDKPVASVILFAGGQGALNISSDGGLGGGRGNFLVRSRQMFARHQLMVAVIDAPSDRMPQGLGRFRVTAEHARDIAGVIAALRKEAHLPVWLIGTSRGTTSAASATIALKTDGPDGIVLTSSIVSAHDWGSVNSMKLAEIGVPALVVHHRNDQCRHCLIGDVTPLMDGLRNSPKTELVAFDGGGPVKGDPCEPWHYHGFVGIEPEVVARIAGWIKTNSKH